MGGARGRPARGAASWLGKLWASPNTALGLVLALAGLPFGARLRRGDNALDVLDHPLLSLTRACAITVGNTVLYGRGARPDLQVRRSDGGGWQRLGDHERAHTVQYERWGPFFLPVYLLLALLPGTHLLEAQADRWAERRRRNLGRGGERGREVGPEERPARVGPPC